MGGPRLRRRPETLRYGRWSLDVGAVTGPVPTSGRDDFSGRDVNLRGRYLTAHQPLKGLKLGASGSPGVRFD
jgi:hypothetical protein